MYLQAKTQFNKLSNYSSVFSCDRFISVTGNLVTQDMFVICKCQSSLGHQCLRKFDIPLCIHLIGFQIGARRAYCCFPTFPIVPDCPSITTSMS